MNERAYTQADLRGQTKREIDGRYIVSFADGADRLEAMATESRTRQNRI